MIDLNDPAYLAPLAYVCARCAAMHKHIQWGQMLCNQPCGSQLGFPCYRGQVHIREVCYSCGTKTSLRGVGSHELKLCPECEWLVGPDRITLTNLPSRQRN